MRTIVDGLEMHAICHGINLRCDFCGDKFIADPDTRDESELRRQARMADWTGPLTRESNEDRCPKCGASVLTQLATEENT